MSPCPVRHVCVRVLYQPAQAIAHVPIIRVGVRVGIGIMVRVRVGVRVRVRVRVGDVTSATASHDHQTTRALNPNLLMIIRPLEP